MSFKTGFNTTPATTQFTFGTPSATTTAVKPTAFGASTFSFNTPATSAPAMGSFGAPAATGFGNVSATTSTSTFSNPGTTFGFGTNTTGFGSTPASTSSINFGGFGNFGAKPATTQAPSLFGGFNTTSTASTGGFGASTTFGAPASTTNRFGTFGAGGGLLGTTNTSFGGFPGSVNQSQQQQDQTNIISEALYNAVFNVQLFNDERDNTIARWNLIQALWGVGKVYYSGNAPPIELTQENPLCRFKAIGYNLMPNTDNNEGLVVLFFQKKESEIKDGKQQLIASMNNILGNKPNLTVTIDGIQSVGKKKSQVTLFVSEKGVTGLSRKIPANEMVGYLTQTVPKGQLEQLGVRNIFAQVKFDPSQLKEYLDNPPCSIDPRLWKQAQLDNPNPNMYIPVPMIGFQDVKYRLKCQEEESAKHRAFLDMAAERVQGLQRQHTATQARLKEHRRSLLELQHKVLHVLVRQETTRKIGLSLQPEEETLTNRFEAMHSQINTPTQFKGRISEMLSQLRMRRHIEVQNQERYTMDPIAQDDIKAYLGLQQQGMCQLIDTIKIDMESLDIIKDGMTDLLTGHAMS